MKQDLETKLSAARTRLILDRPFLGALVLHLPLVEADPSWCKTAATDARALYYNKAYMEALSLEQVQFVLAHEVMHCALLHFARRQNRVKHRWDIACDHAVNPLLVEEGLKPPPDVLYLDEFKGMSAEEIYPYIKDDSEEETLDEHLYDKPQGGGEPRQGESGGAPPPEPLKPQEQEDLKMRWQQRLANAAQQARQVGKLSGAMARAVEHLLEPELPWRALLWRYLSPHARDDYSYQRPSRREGEAIFPSLRSGQLDMVVVVDTSGSIGEEELQAFLTEVNALKGMLRARVTLHACDAELAPEGPWIFEPWEELVLPESLQGGGGTSFIPPFRWVEAQDMRPDVLLYFTDAEGEFPKAEPPFPVLWLVKGKKPVPWGSRIQLN